MRLLLNCLAAILVTNSIAVDVEKTVLQVESILKQNTQLPRLSREEILQLLNDIRAEDARSSKSRESRERSVKKSINVSTESRDSSKSQDTSEKNKEIGEPEQTVTELPNIEENFIVNDHYATVAPTEATTNKIRSTTRKPEPTLMVVLPYTPRDGSSLQELYTRPPRVEVVPVSKATSESNANTLSENRKKFQTSSIHETLRINAQLANKAQTQEFPDKLKDFLNAHGLNAKPGQDHFLLPLEGFKPLPPPMSVDSSVELPENILLTYDLVPSDSSSNPKNGGPPPTTFLFEPLPQEPNFELDGSASEFEKAVLPLDLPKSRITKDVNSPNYAPIDYDAVKVIPLKQGLAPVESEESLIIESEFKEKKRQTENSTSPTDDTNLNNVTMMAPELDLKVAPSTGAAGSDFGASITDLEDSFGGAAPSQPGDAELPPPKKNGFYWMLDWNSFLEVGDGDTKVNIRFEPKLGDPQMFLPVNVP